jgi:hypothetical protein
MRALEVFVRGAQRAASSCQNGSNAQQHSSPARQMLLKGKELQNHLDKVESGEHFFGHSGMLSAVSISRLRNAYVFRREMHSLLIYWAFTEETFSVTTVRITHLYCSPPVYMWLFARGL